MPTKRLDQITIASRGEVAPVALVGAARAAESPSNLTPCEREARRVGGSILGLSVLTGVGRKGKGLSHFRS